MVSWYKVNVINGAYVNLALAIMEQEWLYARGCLDCPDEPDSVDKHGKPIPGLRTSGCKNCELREAGIDRLNHYHPACEILNSGAVFEAREDLCSEDSVELMSLLGMEYDRQDYIKLVSCFT